MRCGSTRDGTPTEALWVLRERQPSGYSNTNLYVIITAYVAQIAEWQHHYGVRGVLRYNWASWCGLVVLCASTYPYINLVSLVEDERRNKKLRRPESSSPALK